jgi:hypothetical protein
MIIRELIIKEHRALTEAQARAQLMEDPVFRQFRSIGRYITERKMTDSEILQVFADVEAGMTDKATGANRTTLGRTKDTAMDFAGGVKDAYDSIINSIQSNATVAAVDVAYNEATDALAKVAGGQNGAVMNAIKKYRMLVKEYPKTAGFAKAALVAIAGLATGGAGLPIIAGLTYALDSAIKGDKLSSVIGKGVGAAALSYAGQAAYGAYGDQAGAGAGAGVGDGTAMGDTTPPDTGVPPTDAVPSRFDEIVSNSVDYKVKPDDTLSDILADRKINPEAFRRLPGNDIFFSPDGNPNILKAGQTIKLPDPSDIPDLNRMSYTTPDPANYARFDKEYDTTGYTGQYNPNNSPYSLDATTNLKQQGLGRLGPDGGIAADRVAQDAGADVSSAGTNNFRADNMNRMVDKFDAEYYRDKPDDFGINPRSNDAVGTGMPGSASSQGFTGTSVAGMPVIPGQPLNPTQMAVSDMAIKMGNRLSPVVQAAYDLAKSGAVRESSWSKVAESVKFKTLPVNRLIDDRITILSWALNESIGRKSKSINLTTVGVYTVFENIDRYRKAILGERLPSTEVGPGREQLPDYGRPDAPGAPAPVTPAAKKSLFGRGLDAIGRGVNAVGRYASNIGHQFTTNVTKEKLKMNWQLKGKPSESDQLSAWLVTQGVPQQVITTVYNKMGIPHTAPASTPAATGTAPTAATTDVAKNYNAQLARNPYAKTSATVTPTPGPTPAPALPKPGVETPPAPGATADGPSDAQIANWGRSVATATDEILSRSAARRDLNPRFKAIVDAEIAKRASRPPALTPTPAPTTPGVNAKTQRDARQLAKGPLKWKSRQPSVQPKSVGVGEEDDYYDALANREDDREAIQNNLKKLPRSAFESLSWSKNFNPGMTLFRQMKREQL